MLLAAPVQPPGIAPAVVAGQALCMARVSDAAELSTLRSQVDELTQRVVRVAERYAETPDSVVAAELFAAERALLTARRSITRALAALST